MTQLKIIFPSFIDDKIIEPYCVPKIIFTTDTCDSNNNSNALSIIKNKVISDSKKILKPLRFGISDLLQLDKVNEDPIVYPVTRGLMLAEEYKKRNIDPTGWWASEKYDGIRVLWDGLSLWTRACNQINAPTSFIERLPRGISLDGELYIKKNYFNQVSGIVRNKVPNILDWQPIKFMVFDIPHIGNQFPFEKRIELITEIVNKYGEPLKCVNHIKIKSATHLQQIHQNLLDQGAEGTMIREPMSLYIPDRTCKLLKVKDQYDEECVVLGYEEGSNKNLGRLGALEVSWCKPEEVWEKFGQIWEVERPYYGPFKVGSGLTDADRPLLSDAEKHFPIGTIIRLAFTQLQKSGKPKHPVYKGIIHK